MTAYVFDPAALATSPQPPTNTNLEQLTYQGFFCEFYDPTGTRHGLPTYPYHAVPAHLATRRQLRTAGLRPDGHSPVAQLLWWHRNRQRRVAYLYDATQAMPKRTATPAQLAAVDKALTARRTCHSCGQVKPYYIPRSLGSCLDCHDSDSRDADCRDADCREES
jgi:hypothetical protein